MTKGISEKSKQLRRHLFSHNGPGVAKSMAVLTDPSGNPVAIRLDRFCLERSWLTMQSSNEASLDDSLIRLVARFVTTLCTSLGLAIPVLKSLMSSDAFLPRSGTVLEESRFVRL